MQVHIRPVAGDVRILGVQAGRWSEVTDGERLDLSRLWALPGLVDAHAHLSADTLSFDDADPAAVRRRMYAAVEAGVFVCIDKGWSDDVVLRVAAEPPTGPRPLVEGAGVMLAGPGGYYPDFAEEVDEDDLARVVAERVEAGTEWVKLVGDWPRRDGDAARFSTEALARAVAVAHAGGARVAVHTMAPGMASRAVEAGVDSIEHGLYLTEHDVAALAERKGVWVPTVLRMEEVLGSMRPGSTGAAVISNGLDNVARLLPVAAETGLAVFAGTDLAVPSTMVGAEAAALARKGLPAAETVASVGGAWRAARNAGPDFSPGGMADVVAFERDPMSDPSALIDPVVVIRGGVVVRDRRTTTG